MGRKSKLTPDIQQQIVTLLKEGHFVEVICKYIGVSYVTYYEWIKKGEAQSSGKYTDFVKAIQEAESKAEMILLSKVDDPKYVLERRFGKRWGKKVEVSGDQDNPIHISVNFIAPKEVK